jgi:hypothetical protein
MTDNTIVDKVLAHLQGYVLESKVSKDELSDLDYDKKISSYEILTFYEIASSYALSYLNRTEFPTRLKKVENSEVEAIDPIVDNAVCMWTAGKIWQKYNVRVNNNEDDTNTLGYGDKLVIQAKEMLKPYKYFNMKVY